MTPAALKAAIDALKAALPERAYSTDPDIIAPHVVEWRDKFRGHSPILLRPDTPQQAAQIVRLCAQHRLALVPQGGNTGLVGGNTPMGEALLSTQRLTKIRHVGAQDNVMIAEAGVTLLAAQKAAADAGRKYPLSLASEGSCTIGGTLSTNAGGVHVIKYGSARDLCLGIEAILPSGEIFNGLSRLRKDNTGYDLSRLLMGAEGTLGIITAAALRLFPAPRQTLRAMAALRDPQAALALLGQSAGPALSMFELIPRFGLELVLAAFPHCRDPFNAPSPWYVLLDYDVYSADSDAGHALDLALERAAQDGIITDAVVAQSAQQAASLLALRENLSEAQKYAGGSVKCDVSVPIGDIPEFLRRASAAVKRQVPECRPVTFGHMGDGNIHFNISQPEGADKDQFLAQWDALTEAVHDVAVGFGGSISAEHGIGTLKKDELARRADPGKMTMMRNIKTALDPLGIMNPRVLF